MEVKKETDVKYVHYGDIHTNIADEIDKNNNLPFINEIYKEYDELKLDDVIVADASEDYKGIADAAVIISNLPYTIIAGLHTIALRPTSLIKGYFLYHIFKTENFKRFGYKIGTGLKVFGISYNNLAKYKVYYPQEIEEQEKIIGILSNLTNSINLHERKCEELALIKQALLQKLFPKKDEVIPEVRYKSFSAAWEQRKLGEVIVSEHKGKVKSSMKGGNTNYLETNYLNGGIAQKVNATADVSKNDVLILWDGSKAGTVYHGFEGALGSTLKVYVPKCSGDFLYQILKKDQDKIYQRYRTPNIPHVIKNFTEKFIVSIPNVREQEKIAEFFHDLDSLIALHQRKLEKLKQLKKFLLQNMFI